MDLFPKGEKKKKRPTYSFIMGLGHSGLFQPVKITIDARNANGSTLMPARSHHSVYN